MDAAAPPEKRDLRILLKPKPTGTVRALFSLVALALAPLSWWWSIDDPALRSTGATAWMMISAALFLAISAAWRDRRRWIVGVAVFQVAMAGFAGWAFFAGQRLPGTAPPGTVPDFTLPDQDGNPVRLAEELARGPVLLVFYRGHW